MIIRRLKNGDISFQVRVHRNLLLDPEINTVEVLYRILSKTVQTELDSHNETYADKQYPINLIIKVKIKQNDRKT